MMQATYISPLYTSMTWQEAAESLRNALRHYVKAVSLETLSLVMAKTAIESGRWGLRPGAMKCWNIGNIKADEKSTGMFTCFACDEILQVRGRVWFEPDGREQDSRGWTQPIAYSVPPGHPQTRFRAYAGKTDGCYQYIDFLAQRKRYRAAWDQLLRGDAVAYVRALKAANYFTADEAKYRRGVVLLQREFLGKLEGLEVPDTDLGDDGWDELRALVARDRFDDIGIIRDDALRHDLTGNDPNQGGDDVA